MKYCIDCKHAEPSRETVFWFSKLRWKHATCKALPVCNSKDELIPIAPMFSAGLKAEHHHCSTARKDFDLNRQWCGPEAKLWEAK